MNSLLKIGYLFGIYSSLVTPLSYTQEPKKEKTAVVQQQNTIEDAVRAGYQSLASRTIQELNSAQKKYFKDDLVIKVFIDKSHEALNPVSESGDANKIKGVLYFTDINRKLEAYIPNKFKPKNVEDTFSKASRLVACYRNLPPDTNLLKRAGITQTKQADQDERGGIYFGVDTKLNILRLSYDSNNPGRSLIYAVHECIHLTQDNLKKEIIGMLEEIIGMLEEATKKPRMGILLERIRASEILMQKAAQERFFNNPLSIFSDEEILMEVLKIATEVGIDINSFKEYLEKTFPVLETLYCIYEGEAYLAESEVIRSFKGYDRRTSDVLSLIGLMDVWDTISNNTNTPKIIRGIGLVETLKKHEKFDKAIENPENLEQILER